jgi:hypothetical protein
MRALEKAFRVETEAALRVPEGLKTDAFAVRFAAEGDRFVGVTLVFFFFGGSFDTESSSSSSLSPSSELLLSTLCSSSPLSLK